MKNLQKKVRQSCSLMLPAIFLVFSLVGFSNIAINISNASRGVLPESAGGTGMTNFSYVLSQKADILQTVTPNSEDTTSISASTLTVNNWVKNLAQKTNGLISKNNGIRLTTISGCSNTCHANVRRVGNQVTVDLTYVISANTSYNLQLPNWALPQSALTIVCSYQASGQTGWENRTITAAGAIQPGSGSASHVFYSGNITYTTSAA